MKIGYFVQKKKKKNNGGEVVEEPRKILDDVVVFGPFILNMKAQIKYIIPHVIP